MLRSVFARAARATQQRSTSSSTYKESTLRSFISSLRARYPLADPPSLIASFLILHELTAIVPLFLGFCALKSAGVGESLLSYTIESSKDHQEDDWAAAKITKWVKEGTEQGERVGRRYGVLGFEKESKSDREARKQLELTPNLDTEELRANSLRIGGDVANLVAAYIAVKVRTISFHQALTDG